MNRVVELLTAYHPRFARADCRQVERWMADGCDLERDVLPVVREWTEKKADIYSLGFFARYVREAKQDRERREGAVHRTARTIRRTDAARRVGRPGASSSRGHDGRSPVKSRVGMIELAGYIITIGVATYLMKVALRDLSEGEDVIEYGVRTAIASADIATGDYVHVHNVRSARWQNSVA